MAVQKSDKSVPVTHVNGPDIRVGGRAKNLSPPVVHDGMHHTQDGAFNAGVSKTESASALQGYQLPTDPVKQHGSKQLPVPACNPGTPSRADRGTYDPVRAGRVMGAAAMSGSTKLPQTTTED